MNMKGKILNNQETKEPRSAATDGTGFTEGGKDRRSNRSKRGKNEGFDKEKMWCNIAGVGVSGREEAPG
jgi:hypothetical protein